MPKLSRITSPNGAEVTAEAGRALAVEWRKTTIADNINSANMGK
jgi:hypothetical protein